jgi:glycosyltransferase involved in cell wall biosynthesis
MSLPKESLKVNHEYFPALKNNYEENKPIFTVFIDCYYNKNYLMQAIDSVQNQTYQNTELLLIDNASIEDVPQYLENIYQSADNVSLITYNENIFSWEDTEYGLVIFYNAAVHYAKGEYVLHLDYDDLISDNFVDKMVQLFKENENCTTATGLPIFINGNGDITESTESRNQRCRYTNGFDIAINKMSGENKLCNPSGATFAFNKEVFISHGGYDRLIEITQIFKHAITGDSGYDADALYYRRDHDGALNKQIKKSGYLWYKPLTKALLDSDLIKIWRDKYGDTYAMQVQNYVTNSIEGLVFSCLGGNLVNFRIKSQINNLINVRRQCPHLLGKALWEVIKFYFLLPKFFVGIMLKREHKERIKLFLSKKNVY